MDYQKKDHPDPTKKSTPKLLTHNVPTDDVENANSTI